jgi:hypothetical protein
MRRQYDFSAGRRGAVIASLGKTRVALGVAQQLDGRPVTQLGQRLAQPVGEPGVEVEVFQLRRIAAFCHQPAQCGCHVQETHRAVAGDLGQSLARLVRAAIGG